MSISKGEWRICRDGSCPCGQVFAEGDKHVATTHQATEAYGAVVASWTEQERRPNGRAIASIPNMLKLLREARAFAVRCEACRGMGRRLPPDYIFSNRVEVPKICGECKGTGVITTHEWHHSVDDLFSYIGESI